MFADLVMDADPKQFAVLFPKLTEQGEGGLALLAGELARTLLPRWIEPPFAPAWKQPDQALVGKVEAAHGLVGERFAFCQTMPLKEFLEVAEALRPCGYRPVQFRPYAAGGGSRRVAAVWSRDGQDWRLADGLSAEEVLQRDEQADRESFVPVDLTAYGAGERRRFGVLWSRVAVDSPEAGKPSGLEKRLSYRVGSKLALTWKVRFHKWERVGPMKPPADWEAILKSPVLDEVTLSELAFDWTKGMPSKKVPAVHVAAVATAEAALAGEAYVLQVTFDDGVRVWLDDKVVFEKWTFNHPTTRSVLIKAEPGRHGIKVEYFQIDGGYALSVEVGEPDLELKAAPTPPAIVRRHGSPAAQMQQARELAAQRYRPSGIQVAEALEGQEASTVLSWSRPPIPTAEQDALARRQANAAVALLRLGQPEKVWPLLKRAPPDDPRVRSYLIHRFGPLGADPGALVKRLEEEKDETIRRGLILSLGPEEFAEQAWSPEGRRAVVERLKETYRTAVDPGLHAAAEWLLRQWKEEKWLVRADEVWAKDGAGREKRIEEIRQELVRGGEKGKPHWYVNGQGQTLVVIPGPVEFLMGSPPTEAGRRGDEGQHRRRIGPTFAIAAKAVTREQFLRFAPSFSHSEMHRYPDPTCPIGGMTWHEAASYCNWLSEREGIPPDQWCYETTPDGRVKSLKENYLGLTGYRLATEAEWEYACRAGAVTAWYYGESEELLPKYTWYVKNAGDRTWAVGMKKPNDLGRWPARPRQGVQSWRPQPSSSWTTTATPEPTSPTS